jgi:hypothetical protein
MDVHGDTNALAVEVGHDELETLVLLSDQVGDGDLDVLEGDVGGARGPSAGALHLTGRQAGHVALDEQERDAAHALAAGPHSDGLPRSVSEVMLLTRRTHKVGGGDTVWAERKHGSPTCVSRDALVIHCAVVSGLSRDQA